MTDDTPTFDDETRGRIKYHAEHGRMDPLLRSIDSSIPTQVVENCADEGIERPIGLIDHYAKHGDFTTIDGVGSSTSESIEAALPLLEEALGIEHTLESMFEKEPEPPEGQETTLADFGV